MWLEGDIKGECPAAGKRCSTGIEARLNADGGILELVLLGVVEEREKLGALCKPSRDEIADGGLLLELDFGGVGGVW